MAKITVMPHLEIISGFKGVVDFYVHDGQPCARRWPRSPGHRRAPEVEAQWEPFTQATRLWNQLSPEVREAYITMAAGTKFSGRDLFSRSYLKGLFTYPTGG